MIRPQRAGLLATRGESKVSHKIVFLAYPAVLAVFKINNLHEINGESGFDSH
jgi:hypothetical protein